MYRWLYARAMNSYRGRRADSGPRPRVRSHEHGRTVEAMSDEEYGELLAMIDAAEDAAAEREGR